MKKFKYSLESLKKLRESELEIAAIYLHECEQAIKRTEEQIDEREELIKVAQNALLKAESKQGQLHPDLRRMTQLYTGALYKEQQEFELQLAKEKTQKEEAMQVVLTKKQECRMLVKHEQHLFESHVDASKQEQYQQADELWLLRSHATADSKINHSEFSPSFE